MAVTVGLGPGNLVTLCFLVTLVNCCFKIAEANHENKNVKYLQRATACGDPKSRCGQAISRHSVIQLAIGSKLELRQILVVSLALLTTASLVMTLMAVILSLRIVTIVQFKEF